jgi:hypothetical protein
MVVGKKHSVSFDTKELAGSIYFVKVGGYEPIKKTEIQVDKYE